MRFMSGRPGSGYRGIHGTMIAVLFTTCPDDRAEHLPGRLAFSDNLLYKRSAMNRIAAAFIILALCATPLVAPAGPADSGGQWRAYVCRVTDWLDCEQIRNDKRVYPDAPLYPDEDTCLARFGDLFEKDPVISSKYPQTNDADNSYVFDCEQVK